MKKKELLQIQEMKPTKLMIRAMTEDKVLSGKLNAA